MSNQSQPGQHWSTRIGRRRLLQASAAGSAGLAALALVGCGDDNATNAPAPSGKTTAAGATQGPVKGGTLQFANWSTFGWSDFVDPAYVFPHAATWHAARLYGEYLVDHDDKGSIKPALAEKWSFDATGAELSLQLVAGAKFQDGTPVDAAAVQYTFDRVYQTDKRPAGLMIPAKPKPAVTITDARTVVLKLPKADPDYLAALAGNSPFGLVSPTAYKTVDDPWGWRAAVLDHPVTAGAFKLVDWQKNQSRRFERFDGYYKANQIYLDAVVDRFVSDGSQRATLVRTGEAQLTTYLNPQDYPSLKSDNNLNTFLLDGNRVITATPNFLSIFGPDNAKTRTWRQALLMAIDRKTIVDKVLSGLGEVADSPMLPTQDGYKNTKVYPYDPDKAKKMLQDSGWDFNRTLVVYFSGSAFTGEQATTEAIQAMWSVIGVKAKLQQFTDFNAMLAGMVQAQNKDWDLLMIGWTMNPNIAERVKQLFNSKGTVNYHSIANYVDDEPLSDQITEELQTTFDPAKRKQLLSTLQDHVMEDLPYLYLFRQKTVIAASKKLLGTTSTIFECLDIRSAYLTA